MLEAAAGGEDDLGGNGGAGGKDRKLPGGQGGMKSKWLKAFTSLKSKDKEPEK